MMLNLDDRKWRAFLIEDLFDSENSKAYHSNDLVFSANARTAYITRTSNNNGLYDVVNTNNASYEINKGNTISFGAETAEFFYQASPYITGNKMYYLHSENIKKFNALFIITELRNGIKNCFSYANGAIPDRVIRKSIMLPVDSYGEPDYAFMEHYIKEREDIKKKTYIDYCKAQLAELGDIVDVEPLSNKVWQEFFIEEIFVIKPGKRLESYNMISGKRPFIGATDSGNGITNYVSNENKSLDKNVLGVNYNGNGVVISFYHPYECLFSDDVKRFHLKNYSDNKYVLLFFKTVILQQKSKYNYGYKFNSHRMERQIICVPVNDAGEPDYNYMEQYTKNIMIQKYQSYLDYMAVQ